MAHTLVAAVLEALGPELERETAAREPGRIRLARPAAYRAYTRPRPADPVAHLVDGHRAAAVEIAGLVAGAPPSRPDLDHVAATADTALRRGLFLATRFDLPGRRLLCVGDHDLTSLATALVCPDAQATVVDVDERMLEYIDTAATRLGLPVSCHYADLRLGLPPGLRGRADLVFTDPPYTAEGVELFVRRGLEGMADPRRGRVLVAYGASETTPRLIAATQARLSRLQLVVEALWPDFNRYLGAESIGAASDLYVLRPLARSAPPAGADAARIYSQGANAKEARGALSAAAARSVLREIAARDGGPPPVLAGSWPSADPDAPPAGEEVLSAPRMRLSTWFDSPAASADAAAVDLTGGWEALLGRAVLAGTAATTYLVVPSRAEQVRDAAGQEKLRRLLSPRFEVRFLRGLGAPNLTVVRARRLPAPDPVGQAAARLLWYCQDRAHGVLTGTLRQGLAEVAAARGTPVNKRTARLRVASVPAWVSGHTLLDLPGHRFGELAEVAAGLVADLADPAS